MTEHNAAGAPLGPEMSYSSEEEGDGLSDPDQHLAEQYGTPPMRRSVSHSRMDKATGASHLPPDWGPPLCNSSCSCSFKVSLLCRFQKDEEGTQSYRASEKGQAGETLTLLSLG